MKAVVLVGGEGTRLRPLTYRVPKQLLLMCGIPMLERVLAHLSPFVEEVVLSVGYKPEVFSAWFKSARLPVKARMVVEPELLDTAGAIRFASYQAGINETFIAINGDVLTDLPVEDLVSFHKGSGAQATVSLIEVEDPSRFGVVEIREGRIRRFVEKPPAEQAPSRLANAGYYVLEPEALSSIPVGKRVSIEREVFPFLAEKGALAGFAATCYWSDCGTREAFIRACHDLLLGRLRGQPFLAPELSEGVRVAEDAEVRGELKSPCYLGRGVFFAGDALEGVVLEDGAVVEEGARVVGSCVMPGARIRGGAFVKDSIVGESALVEEGARVSECIVAPHTQVAPHSSFSQAQVGK